MKRKQNKPKGRSQKSAPIDGIVSDGRLLGSPQSRTSQTGNQSADQVLGTLTNREEGFHPMRQSPGGLGQAKASAEEVVDDDLPIAIDSQAIAKKRRRRLWPGRPPARQLLKHLSLALVAFALVGGIFLGIKLFIAYRQVLQGGGNAPALATNIDINQLKHEGDGRVNVLLLGIGGPGHDAPDLTDTILLASIDPFNHKTVLLSIPRDLWVQIPDDGYQKINAAYHYGKQRITQKNVRLRVQTGLKLLDNTLNNVLEIPIHYHLIVNFTAFKEAVNSVGGVTVNVPEQLYDSSVAWENNYNPLIAKKGTQKFNGSRALLYVKSRETSSDFARAERQRLMLVALKDKVLSLGTYSNPVRISQLLNNFGSNVYSDFSVSDLPRLYEIISQNPSLNIKSLDLVTPPHQLLTTANVNGLSVVVPTAGTFNYNPIQSYVRSKLPDGLILKENAAVAIYNATSQSGLATKQSKLLKSYGYRVVKIDNTPEASNPAKTILVDLTNGVNRFTRHYLENRYKTIAQSSIPKEYGLSPPEGTAFVIILGNDVK